MAIRDRLKHAWNAFLDETLENRLTYHNAGAVSYNSRQDRPRMNFFNERSIIASIYNRISIDVAAVAIRHVRNDKDGRYLEDVDSGLNECLTVEANLDQGARHFLQDIASSMFNQGCIAIVPVDTTLNPNLSGGYDIKTMRVGEIVGWLPYHVRVRCYNEKKGMREEITLDKKFVAIVENPLYSVMNEPNSTLQRLIRKLNLLDTTDEQQSSGKLDIIIQLPYVIKSEARRTQADQRRKDVEHQLTEGKYGIAYTDGTEKITQLNRPVENKLLEQIKELKDQLYAELGLTPDVMNGTADEKAMINYYNRTIEPILAAITQAMKRTFLTKTARSQGQSIEAFRDPFKLITMEELAEIADKFTRNEILSANEIRQGIGIKPSKDKKADELRNSNMPQAGEGDPEGDAKVQAMLGDLNKDLEGLLSGVGAM
jgi:hypothetical protein